MAEQAAEQVQEQVAAATTHNPFDEANWSEKPAQEENKEQSEIKPEIKPETTTSESEEVIDEDEVYKREFGKTKAEFKTEYEELKKLREQKPEEIKFANETSQKYFDAIINGKEDVIYDILHSKRVLSNADKLDAKDAIKLHIKQANQHYKEQDVEDVFKEKYSVPKKPAQGLETDEEYSAVVAEWQENADFVNRKIERDAFSARQELAKLNTELVLPDIERKSEAPQAAISQEEFGKIKAAYLQSLEGGLKDFNGYTVTAMVNNGEVKIPVSYAITNEEKIAQRATLEQFDMDAYFEKRWLNEDGSHNARQLADDTYILENKEKIFQKIANEAANNALANYIKSKTNVSLNGSSNNGTFQPEAASYRQKQEEAIWSA